MRIKFSAMPLLGLTASIALLGAGCANLQNPSKDEYKTIFSQVIRKSLGETAANNVCLPQTFFFVQPAQDSFELNVTDVKTNAFLRNQLSQFKALESAGLISSVESDRTVNGKDQKILSFSRTAQGNGAFSNGTFCYARAEFDSVVKWKGPVKLGDYQAAFVYYTTKTTHVADWARSDEMLAAFPAIASNVNDGPSKVRQVAIDLSSEGWDIAEYSKLLQLQ